MLNSEFRSGKNSYFGSLMIITPMLTMLGGLSWLGFQIKFILDFIPVLPMLIIFTGLLFGLQIMRNERSWNLAVLMIFAAWTGVAFNTVSWQIAWEGSGQLFLIIVGISGWLGGRKPGKFQKSSSALWVISWLYFLGWVLIVFLIQKVLIKLVWVWAGLVLFFLMAVNILGTVKNPAAEDDLIPTVIDLYLIYLNLFWLTGLAGRFGS